MTTTQALAHLAYQTYVDIMVPLAPWGTPAFADLPDLHQRAWEAVAVAVLETWQARERREQEARTLDPGSGPGQVLDPDVPRRDQRAADVHEADPSPCPHCGLAHCLLAYQPLDPAPDEGQARDPAGPQEPLTLDLEPDVPREDEA